MQNVREQQKYRTTYIKKYPKNNTDDRSIENEQKTGKKCTGKVKRLRHRTDRRNRTLHSTRKLLYSVKILL